jgi:hypothetical protein
LYRLQKREKKVYGRAGRNAGGVKVKDSLREWYDKMRQKPPDERWRTAEAVAHQSVLIKVTLKATVKEWEKVMAKGLVGELRDSCTTAWKKKVPDQSTHHTMRCESNLGNMKYVARRMVVGRIAARKAKVNARMSNTWEVFDRMSKEEKEVTLYMSHKLLKHMDEYDEECQELHDTAAAERRFRALRKQLLLVAKEYATALVLHECEVWTVGELEEAVKGATSRALKIDLLEEQLMIIVVGGGMKQWAIKYKNPTGDNAKVMCQCAKQPDQFDNYLNHLTHHVKKAIEYVHSHKDEWPEAPPLPDMTLARPQPILSNDKESSSLPTMAAELSKEAKGMVTSGKVTTDCMCCMYCIVCTVCTVCTACIVCTACTACAVCTVCTACYCM